jgi:hypothetical protein
MKTKPGVKPADPTVFRRCAPWGIACIHVGNATRCLARRSRINGISNLKVTSSKEYERLL